MQIEHLSQAPAHPDGQRPLRAPSLSLRLSLSGMM
jgi:hypothetical protein